MHEQIEAELKKLEAEQDIKAAEKEIEQCDALEPRYEVRQCATLPLGDIEGISASQHRRCL